MWIVTKEALIGVVRTVVMYVYALLLTRIPVVNEWLINEGWADEVQNFVSGSVVVLLGTALYAAVRWAAEKWPQLGYLFIFNTKPAYDENVGAPWDRGEGEAE